MDDLWQQFHRLPRVIRDSVATPTTLAVIDQLERDHPGLDLANIVMRVMVKEFPLADLPKKLQDENKLPADVSTTIADRMKRDVFASVAEYLGAQNVPTASPPPVQPATPTPPAQSGMTTVAPKPVEPIVSPAPMPPTQAQPIPVKQIPPLLVTPPPTPPLAPPMSPTMPTSAPPLPPVTAVPPPGVRPSGPIPARPTGPMAPTQNYSEEEAKEIEQQSVRIKTLQTMSALDFDSIAQRIFERHQLAWPNELLTKRAFSIAKARLKEIRDSDTTLDILSRDPKIGGLGLDPDIARQLVFSLEDKAKELKSRGMVAQPQPIVEAPLPVPTPVQPTKPVGMPPLTTVIPETGLPPGPMIPVGVTDEPRLSRPIKRPPELAQIMTSLPPAAPPAAPTPRVTPAPMPASGAVPFMQRARVAERPRMSDISQPHAAPLGPAEEMKSLTLSDWRRLGQGANESARTLLEKFRHLQKESFSLWTTAISGWRQSEVFQIYLAMGQQSLNQNMPIDAVVQQRAKAGQPYLSQHEFNTVADINRQLQSY